MKQKGKFLLANLIAFTSISRLAGGTANLPAQTILSYAPNANAASFDASTQSFVLQLVTIARTKGNRAQFINLRPNGLKSSSLLANTIQHSPVVVIDAYQ